MEVAREQDLTTTSIDEAVDLASRAQLPLRADFRRPREPFRFRIRSREFGRVSVSEVRMDYGDRFSVESETTGDAYHFQLNLEGGGRVRYAGWDIAIAGRRRGLLLTPGRPVRWTGEGGFREVSVNVDRRLVEEHYEALSGHSLEGTIEFEPSVDVTSGPGARLPGLASHTEALLDTLLLGLPHSHDSRLRVRAPAGSRQLVLRAEEYMDAGLEEPLTIRRVALALGVSIRTLQRSFARHRTYSPKRFLAERRLRLAREALRAGEQSSVTRVALATGHSHLGQFSVDYRRRFGESPSQTLLARFR